MLTTAAHFEVELPDLQAEIAQRSNAIVDIDRRQNRRRLATAAALAGLGLALGSLIFDRGDGPPRAGRQGVSAGPTEAPPAKAPPTEAPAAEAVVDPEPGTLVAPATSVPPRTALRPGRQVHHGQPR